MLVRVPVVYPMTHLDVTIQRSRHVYATRFQHVAQAHGLRRAPPKRRTVEVVKGLVVRKIPPQAVMTWTCKSVFAVWMHSVAPPYGTGFV